MKWIQKRYTPLLICIIGFMALSSLSFGQNLVYNPGFEAGADECDFTVYSPFFSSYAHNWSCPTNGTSDIFSTKILNPGCFAAMPYTGEDRRPDCPHVGSILPHSGSRFVGIISFYGDEEKDNDYREYLQGALSEPMVPGEYYCVEFYVAVASRPRYACNSIGIYFYDKPMPFVAQGKTLPFTPQIVETSVIESEEWVRISGQYKATAEMQYFIIGNFNTDKETKFIDKGGYGSPTLCAYNTAYYFVDDVSVIKSSASKITLAGKTRICAGETSQLSAFGNFDSFKWTTLNDTNTVLSNNKTFIAKPPTTTTYRIKGYKCAFQTSDTITIKVDPLPQLDLGADTVVCERTQLKLDAGANTTFVQWQDGSSDRFFTVTNTGIYSVIVKNDFGCAAQDKVKVDVRNPPLVSLGADSLLCGNPFLLSGSKYADTFEWSTGSKDSTLLADKSGLYWLKVKNVCGEAIDSIHVYSPDQIVIPNIVTSNNDGHNDTFQINTVSSFDDPVYLLGNVSLSILNRWGEVVFKEDNYKNDWPDNGSSVCTGIYYYHVSVGNCNSYKGWVQIIE